ncbi:hypothetical protein [Capillimicrobium parvum]|uniref:hypothetical protein n=1 Tax=Capillimicrobium parvum TaxID=2884022 RepID=UPI00216AC680|nr:hypothetical protein [Capillimicrobium parvum]
MIDQRVRRGLDALAPTEGSEARDWLDVLRRAGMTPWPRRWRGGSVRANDVGCDSMGWGTRPL